MRKTTQLLGLPVMGIKEGTQKGIVTDFMIDATTKKVKYLILREGNTYRFFVLDVVNVMGVGENYVTTETINNIKNLFEAEGDMEDAFYMLDTTAVSSNGNIIGTIVSFDFEEKNGTIDTLDLEDGENIEGAKIATMANDIVFIGDEDFTRGDSVGSPINAEVIQESASMPIPEATPESAPVARQPEPESVPVMQEAAPPAVPVQQTPVQTAPAAAPVQTAVPEPAPAVHSVPIQTQSMKPAAPAAAPVPKAAPAKKPLTDYQKKQREFLVGRKAGSRVASKDGRFVIEKGTVLTEDLVDAAEAADVILELTLNVD